DLGDRGATGGVVVLTPAFNRLAAGRMGIYTDVLRVRTNGRGDVPRVLAAADRIFGPSVFSAIDLAGENDGAADAINALTLALWIFAGGTAVAARSQSRSSSLAKSRKRGFPRRPFSASA